MSDFILRFFLCNLFLCIIAGLFLLTKCVLKNHLTTRMQYNLWCLFLGLLIVPFLPLPFPRLVSMFSWIANHSYGTSFNPGILPEGAVVPHGYRSVDWMNDFTLSVNRDGLASLCLSLWGIWLTGILAMMILAVKSKICLYHIKKSALPLRNREIRKIYQQCLAEMHMTKEIPVYSTAFLKSPILVGIFHSEIYLPMHLISDYDAREIRYMLLHELQHYKYKDALINGLMNLAGILYWFNPMVWYVRKEMCNDREVACDTSVLTMLSEADYEDYGNTLINFAEKVSLLSFPLAAGISGSMKQMKLRITNIAMYEKPSPGKKRRGILLFLMIAILLFSMAPALSTYAVHEDPYPWNPSSRKISYMDCSAYFGDYDGSFVLYELHDDAWKIYQMDQAMLRVAPNSTYKLCDALFALEEGLITPEDSFMAWNQEIYPFDAWNQDQTLSSAMGASVNWYFQALDRQLGADTIREYLQKIGYGNQDISGGLSSYWMESSLKISPVEQVEFLANLYQNTFAFAPEHVEAVRDAIRISSSEYNNLYGKTGTGQVNGRNVNGWFIGFVETPGHTYFFATNIQAEDGATGSHAAQIALSILADLNI